MIMEDKMTDKTSVNKIIEDISKPGCLRSATRAISDIGSDVEVMANKEIGLLRGHLDNTMKQVSDGGSKIPQSLKEMVCVMDDLNPKKTGIKSMLPNFLRKTPFFGNAIYDISKRYRTIQDQINTIQSGLESGNDTLLSDTKELENIYDNTKDVEAAVVVSISDMERLISELNNKKSNTLKINSTMSISTKGGNSDIDNAISIATNRLQDLKTIKHVFLQFFTSIDVIIGNNDNLSNSIKRTITITRNVLEVGLALHVALDNQKQISAAMGNIRDYTGQILASNASAIKNQTIDISNLKNAPVIPMKYLCEAYGDLEETIKTTKANMDNSLVVARESISQLDAMSKNLEGNMVA